MPRAFNCDADLKKHVLDRIIEKFDAAEILDDQGRICCTFSDWVTPDADGYDRTFPEQRCESELGIPIVVIYIIENTFRELVYARSLVAAKEWVLECISAIPLGADLTGIWSSLADWLSKNATHCDDSTWNRIKPSASESWARTEENNLYKILEKYPENPTRDGWLDLVEAFAFAKMSVEDTLDAAVTAGVSYEAQGTQILKLLRDANDEG